MNPTLRCSGGIEPIHLKLSHKSIQHRGLYLKWNSGWQHKDPKTFHLEVGHHQEISM